MAQNVFLNAVADAAAAKKQDGADHKNATTIGTAAGGDLTISYDSTKITNLTLFDSCVRQLRRFAQGAGLQ